MSDRLKLGMYSPALIDVLTSAHPSYLFLRFFDQIALDVSLALDFLISNETQFLKLFLTSVVIKAFDLPIAYSPRL